MTETNHYTIRGGNTLILIMVPVSHTMYKHLEVFLTISRNVGMAIIDSIIPVLLL